MRVGLSLYGRLLAAIYVVVWLLAAYQPLDLEAWALEQAGVVLALLVLWRVQRNAPLSAFSLSLVFVFLCMHALGAHYTYAQVPLDEFARAGLGVVPSEHLGWTRNHYDRIVHFLFGLLITYPVLDSLRQHNTLRGIWYYLMPFALVFSETTLYELGEWWAAVIFGGDAGIHFLGIQGDVWDAQKDMALAGVGSAATLLLVALFEKRRSTH